MNVEATTVSHLAAGLGELDANSALAGGVDGELGGRVRVLPSPQLASRTPGLHPIWTHWLSKAAFWKALASGSRRPTCLAALKMTSARRLGILSNVRTASQMKCLLLVCDLGDGDDVHVVVAVEVECQLSEDRHGGQHSLDVRRLVKARLEHVGLHVDLLTRGTIARAGSSI